ncbi:hypothetical protein JCM8097_005878 [Rhodosporidiobolus ruineniae]
MAAAVMRAVTFGLSNNDREGRSEGRRSRPTSRNSSRRREGDDEDAAGTARSLSRSSSRLGVPTGGEHRPASILINGSSSTRGYSPLPSPSTSPPTGAANGTAGLYSTASAASSLTSGLNTLSRPLSAPSSVSPPSTSRPPLGRHASDASSVTGPVTPSTSSFPPGVTSTPSSSTTASTGTDGQAQTLTQQKRSTIRFAPLPEIRPRSYSTGRNVWLEDDPSFAGYVDGDEAEGVFLDEDGEPVRRGLMRRDEYDGMDDYALDPDEEDEEEGRGFGAALGRWGSWTESLGLSPATSRTREREDDAVSVTSSLNGAGGGELERTLSGASSVGAASSAGGSTAGGGSGGGGSKKLLKALGFGRGKSSKKAKPPSSSLIADDDPLSRTSSLDSTATGLASDVLSRRSSLSADPPPSSSRPKGSTGIPMRKAATWEAGDSASLPVRRTETGAPVYYASPARSARRRANYPPVAQRSRFAPPPGRRSVDVRVEEPAFSEWGGGGGVGSVGSAGRAARGAAEEDEDDGSGLAWIKKRRLERERQKREEEERAASAGGEGGEGADERRTAGERGPSPPRPSSSAADEVSTSAPPANSLSTSTSLPSFPSPPPSSEPPSSLSAAAAPRFPHGLARKAPSRSATLDSTTSTGSNGTVRPSTPKSAPPLGPAKSGLSATRPALVVDTSGAEATKAAAAEEEEEEEEEEDDLATPLSAVSVSSTAVDDESDEAENEDDEEEDEDDDLTAEELAREEQLAAAAKAGAKKGMGAERYHSSAHENRMLQVSANEK